MTLSFDRHGTGDELVIVTHSWMTTHTSWSPLKPYLDGDRFTWLFADLRGYGLSRSLTGPHTWDQAALDVLQLADQRGADRFHIVGHSMSGMIAQGLLADAPHRLITATLVTPVPATGFQVDEASARVFAAAVEDDAAWDGIATMMTGERLGPAFPAAHRPGFRATVDPAAMAGFLKMWTGSGFADRMPGRSTRTLAIAGRHDVDGLRPDPLLQTLGGWFDDLTVEGMDTGHFPMIESPPRLAAILHAFLVG